MKMENNQELEDELLPEYDFSNMTGGVRGKYIKRYETGTNIILLAPDVDRAFPTSESVISPRNRSMGSSPNSPASIA